MPAIKVLMISVRADHGGGPRHIEQLLQALPSGVECHVACPKEPPYWDRYHRETDGRVLEIPHRRFSVSRAIALAKYARSHSINLVHAHGKGAGVYGRVVSLLTGCPGLHSPHGVHVGEYGSLARRLYCLYENITARWIARILYVSEEERLCAKDEGLWPKTPWTVVPNGVPVITDVRRQELRASTREATGISSETFVVATISRFDVQKNMGEALSIAKQAPWAQFLWVGDGPERPYWQSKAVEEQAKNVSFLGQLNSSYPILAAADAYLTTSQWEGLPLSVLEAMAVGLPIVASGVVGHRELVANGETGRLYPLGKPDSAVDALKELYCDKSLRRELGKAALSAQRTYYSSDRMARNVGDAYLSLARGD